MENPKKHHLVVMWPTDEDILPDINSMDTRGFVRECDNKLETFTQYCTEEEMLEEINELLVLHEIVYGIVNGEKFKARRMVVVEGITMKNMKVSPAFTH